MSAVKFILLKHLLPPVPWRQVRYNKIARLYWAEGASINMAKVLKKTKSLTPGEEIVSGIRLRHCLRGSPGWFGRIAWSPDGTKITAPAHSAIHIWDTTNAQLMNVLQPVISNKTFYDLAKGRLSPISKTVTAHRPRIIWGPNTRYITFSTEREVAAWDLQNKTLHFHHKEKYMMFPILAAHPDGDRLAYCSGQNILIHNINTHENHKLFNEKSDDELLDLLWSPDGSLLVGGAESGAIFIWDLATKQMTNILEGHDLAVESLSFSGDGRLLASRGLDNSICLWQTETWQRLAKFSQQNSGIQPAGIAFHPTQAVLATLDEGDSVINIWDLDYKLLMVNPEKNDSGHYQNAKVVLVGDTGVGKSDLGLVLTGREFAATDSTDGRHVWTCEEQQIVQSHSLTETRETRETLLWDLAGQPGYRLIHQMHLNEVAVALVICDARSETDPLAGIQHWGRVLMQAHQRQGDGVAALKKFLVVARADRGGIAVSQKRINALVAEKGFDGYFETSAKQGWNIEALKAAMLQAIDWDALPKVTSTALFHQTKQFIISEKEAGRVLCTGDDLFLRFQQSHVNHPECERQSQFETCISRLENRDLIRRLSFGGYILLQPELLDVYASGMINAAKSEPDGLGTLAEEDALVGRFRLSDESRVSNKQQATRAIDLIGDH